MRTPPAPDCRALGRRPRRIPPEASSRAHPDLLRWTRHNSPFSILSSSPLYLRPPRPGRLQASPPTALRGLLSRARCSPAIAIAGASPLQTAHAGSLEQDSRLPAEAPPGHVCRPFHRPVRPANAPPSPHQSSRSSSDCSIVPYTTPVSQVLAQHPHGLWSSTG